MTRAEDPKQIFQRLGSDPTIIDELFAATTDEARRAVLAKHGVTSATVFDKRQVSRVLKGLGQSAQAQKGGGGTESLRPVEWVAAAAAAAGGFCVAN
jgi:hypothetical protein